MGYIWERNGDEEGAAAVPAFWGKSWETHWLARGALGGQRCCPLAMMGTCFDLGLGWIVSLCTSNIGGKESKGMLEQVLKLVLWL